MSFNGYQYKLFMKSHNSTLEGGLWSYKTYFFIVHHVALFVLYNFIILHGIIPENSSSRCFVIAGCVTSCKVLCDY